MYSFVICFMKCTIRVYIFFILLQLCSPFCFASLCLGFIQFLKSVKLFRYQGKYKLFRDYEDTVRVLQSLSCKNYPIQEKSRFQKTYLILLF